MSCDSSVPFNDLARTPLDARLQIERAIADVLASGRFVMGPNHAALEDELAAYLGIGHAVLVANGTDALELALAAVGVRSGDYVVTVANAGAYTSIATRLLGGVPFYADIDPSTLLMSVATFETALSALPVAPKAVVVTHLYGALAPVADIVTVAKRHGIAIVEDCAQSLGARTDVAMGGTFGDIAITSFYPTKNLGALGDGGAVFTDSSDLAAAVRRMRQYGWDSKYHISHVHGRNSRMDELQAAVVRVKLPLLDGLNERRRRIHARYESARPSAAQLVNTSSPAFIAHLAVLTSDSRDRARDTLRAAGIATDVHYPIPDHQQAFPDFTPAPVELPVTEWASGAVFSVPMFPELTDAEVAQVRDAIDSL
ncbi:MAG: DegT/DnrJ/EryC1/StrS family aminotransferase [Microbacteriaceae bacterium]|nr:MAG: DegT/DnrJ/EryC1/StrS family aminotransferase [Microbacteriaceae bacterium]